MAQGLWRYGAKKGGEYHVVSWQDPGTTSLRRIVNFHFIDAFSPCATFDLGRFPAQERHPRYGTLGRNHGGQTG
jgi:hypothetical protein